LAKALGGKNANAIANGFLNRFLLVRTERRTYLPRGGRWKAVAMPFVPAIADAIAVAKARNLLVLDPEAEAVWDAEYEALEQRPEGTAGDATARAADQAMKLGLVYALADKADAIGLVHLRAGQAVWRYCEATAVSLFGGKVTAADAAPDPLWLTLLNAIQGEPGVKRSELVYAHKNAANAEAVGAALGRLRERHLAHAVSDTTGGGRPAERWYPGSGDGDEGTLENTTPPSQPEADPWIVQADEGGGSFPSGKEGSKSEAEGEHGAHLLPSFPTATIPPVNPAGELDGLKGDGDLKPPADDDDLITEEAFMEGLRTMPTGLR
jgi:hypothetical protein